MHEDKSLVFLAESDLMIEAYDSIGDRNLLRSNPNVFENCLQVHVSHAVSCVQHRVSRHLHWIGKSRVLVLRVLSVVQAIYVTLSEKSQVFDVHIFMNDQFAKLVTRNGVLFGLVSLVTLVALLFDKFKDVHMLIAEEDERFVVLCGQSCVEPAVHLFSERFRWRELLDHL